jgi:thiol-disulfide isomerase/thioredoxin
MMVFFTRDWCTPCQVMKPWLEEIRAEHPEVAVAQVNLDRGGNEPLGRFFQISAVPVLVFVDKDGTIRERQEGTRSKKQMLGTLEKLTWLE